MSKGVNFAKDYKKDLYNKNKLMRKNLKDKYVLKTFMYFKKCQILNFKNSKNFSKLIIDLEIRKSKVLYHI
jgi:hypothetical protein